MRARAAPVDRPDRACSSGVYVQPLAFVTSQNIGAAHLLLSGFQQVTAYCCSARALELRSVCHHTIIASCSLILPYSASCNVEARKNGFAFRGPDVQYSGHRGPAAIQLGDYTDCLHPRHAAGYSVLVKNFNCVLVCSPKAAFTIGTTIPGLGSIGPLFTGNLRGHEERNNLVTRPVQYAP
jgi:hypothetical protein